MIAALVLSGHPAAAHSHRAATVSLADDRTVRLVALGPGADRLLERVAAQVGGAVEAVVAFWGSDWSHDVSVQGAGSDEQFAAAAGGPASQWAGIAAVTLADQADPVTRTVHGQRIVVAPGAVDMSPAAFRIVLAHELFHYAARADTALDAPEWLTEGVADYVARPQTAPPRDAGTRGSLGSNLPSDSELDTPGPQRSLAYDRAWWFARFVADAYGPAKLRELYRSVCGAGHVDFGTAAREALGVDSAALLTRWQQWLTR